MLRNEVLWLPRTSAWSFWLMLAHQWFPKAWRDSSFLIFQCIRVFQSYPLHNILFHELLASALSFLKKWFVPKQLIKLDTEVEVEHEVQEFGGSNFDKLDFYNVTAVNGTSFKGTSTVDGEELKFDYNQIVTIDGMSPKRLSQAFGIKY